MFKRALLVLLSGVVIIGLAQSASAETSHRLGVGVHYYTKLGDIDVDNFEEDGLGWIATYQLRTTSLVSFEADLELLPEGFGGLPDNVLAPKAYVIVGGWIYGAVGVGIYYSDGEFADNPFYALRAGFDLELLPSIFADINVEYRFERWDELDGEDIDEDTLELGVAARIEF